MDEVGGFWPIPEQHDYANRFPDADRYWPQVQIGENKSFRLYAASLFMYEREKEKQIL